MSFRFLTGFDSIIDRILSLLMPSQKTVKANLKHKKSTTFLTANDTMTLNSSLKMRVKSTNSGAKDILKQYINNPEELLGYIESHNTVVIKANHIEKVLILMGEEEGFILPQNGSRALFLSLMINILSKKKIKLGFSTPEMFVMRDMPVNIYFLSHQFHHWHAYKHGLPGYDPETMANFKNIWSPDFGSSDINKMTIDEIISLKDAIARDNEAINFVKEISREFIGSKNSLKRLKNGESLNL